MTSSFAREDDKRHGVTSQRPPILSSTSAITSDRACVHLSHILLSVQPGCRDRGDGTEGFVDGRRHSDRTSVPQRLLHVVNELPTVCARWQCAYNVTLRRVRVTIVAMEKQ